MGTILTRKPLRCKHFGASWERLGSLAGGESGIRTHGTVSPLRRIQLQNSCASRDANCGHGIKLTESLAAPLLRASPLTPKNSTIKNRGQLLSFLFAVGTQSYDEFIAAVPLRPRLSIMLGMIHTSDIFSIGENASACTSSGRRVT